MKSNADLKQPVGCPLDFGLNCKNLDIKCIKCTALHTEASEFYYSPISLVEPELRLSKHPYILQLKLNKSKQKREVRQSKRVEPKSQKGRQANRAGHKAERKVIKDMGGKLSYLSGAVAGDGDGKLIVLPAEDGMEALTLKVEHKLRIAKRNILGPTNAEWEIAQKRGIEIFLVTHENSTTVTMSATVFKELLSWIKDLQD